MKTLRGYLAVEIVSATMFVLLALLMLLAFSMCSTRSATLGVARTR